jgi:hypothetical protein
MRHEDDRLHLHWLARALSVGAPCITVEIYFITALQERI